MVIIGGLILLVISWIWQSVENVGKEYQKPLRNSPPIEEVECVYTPKPTVTAVIPTIASSDVPLSEPIIVYKNIASKHPKPLNWFLCPHPDLPAPSHAEALIIDELNQYKVKWYREVSFYGLQTSKYGWPRYDFWIPSYNLLLEYDGITHSRPEVKAMDRLKNKFCKDNGLSIVRYNRKHYYNLAQCIAELMNSHKISKK